MSQNPMDPNKTVIGGGPGTFADPNRTVAMGGVPAAGNVTVAIPAQTQEALAVSVIAGRTVTMANGPAREQFVLEIMATPDDGLPGVSMGGARTALNVCLVIDRSGSMEGAPLMAVKEACRQFIDLLTPNDFLSIVVFDTTVDTLMNPQPVTDREAIKRGLDQIQAGNTTNLYGAVQMGAALAQERGSAGRATRILVLTDGDPTEGVKDYGALVELAGQVKAQGVGATFLGFGPDYNEELLAGMAKRAGGNYVYIAQASQVTDVFRSELSKLLSVAATNLKLELKASRWVRLREAAGFKVDSDARDVTLDLADLERGATLRQGFDLEFTNHPLGHYRVMGGALSYDDTRSGVRRTVPVDFTIEFSGDMTRANAPVDPRVESAMQISAASRVVERTIMGLKTQAITLAGAMQDLQKTQALLVSQGKVAEAQEVTLAMQAIQKGDVGGAEKTLMGTVINLDQGKSGS